MSDSKWKVLKKFQTSKIPKLQIEEIIDILLKNRGIRTKKQREEFFEPTPPGKIGLKELRISEKSIKKVIKRLSEAKKKKEKVIVFGDYDADGVCATAILWECLYELGFDALPYIPDRFSEGYGLKVDSIRTLAAKNSPPALIITVDNGIVASDAVDTANEMGIDVIITDHHLPSSGRGQKGKKLPKAHAIVHTTEIGGAGIAWILAREIRKKFQKVKKPKFQESLELAAIGTISDQLPLIGANRSFAKYGLERLRKTDRVGLSALFDEAGIKPEELSTYHVNFVIAPRINAMGRLEHAIDSLRLLCTKSEKKAKDLANLLGKTNSERQKIVKEVVEHAYDVAAEKKWSGVITLYHESYHEGVIGLAASKLVERFYRPAVVLSKGEEFSKASARSVPGFNIIKTLRKLDMLVDGGGHPMAAGFTLKTSELKLFTKKLDEVATPLLTDDILTKTLKIDMAVDFKSLNWKLYSQLKKFEPTGIGNPAVTFTTQNVKVLNSRAVGAGRRHLKLTLEKDNKVFSAIAFGLGDFSARLTSESSVDIAFKLQENIWNGQRNLELVVKDLKFT